MRFLRGVWSFAVTTLVMALFVGAWALAANGVPMGEEGGTLNARFSNRPSHLPGQGGPVSRIKDVGNPWLDAGIVPFSTLHYREDPEYWAQWFPADFITESFPGQFRNWFYSMLAMSTVLRREEPFRTIFGYATLFGEDGRPSGIFDMISAKVADGMGFDCLYATGFGTVTRPGLTLAGTQVLTIPIELKVGDLQETITVTGETPPRPRAAIGSAIDAITARVNSEAPTRLPRRPKE